MVASPAELPTELLHLILQYLPTSDLLSFARTSKENYSLSILALTSLDIAIFPRRIHSLLAFFDTSEDDDEEEDAGGEDPPISKYWARRSASDKSLHQVGLITPNDNRPSLSRTSVLLPSTPSMTGKQRKNLQLNPGLASTSPLSPPTPLSIRTVEMTAQNRMATTILLTPSIQHLRTLTLRLYDLNSPQLASVLATSFSNLTSLNLEFSHPYIHDTTLPAKFWKDTPSIGSPIWNILAGIGDVNEATLELRSLRSLKLKRSGITSFQLRRWIEANPDLRELRLSLCRGVDADFVTWLADYISSGRSKIETVRLTNCGLLELRREVDFASITTLAATGRVRELSLRGCKNVSEETFTRLATSNLETNRWTSIFKLISPQGVVIKSQQQHQGYTTPGSIASLPLRPTDSNEMDMTSLMTTIQSRHRLGNVSPALTISGSMMSSASDSEHRDGYFGKMIAVDSNCTTPP